MNGCTHDTVRVRWIDSGYLGTCELCGASAEVDAAADPDLGPLAVLQVLGGPQSRWSVLDASRGSRSGRLWRRE